ncbi:MAG: hypothetical protein J5641_06700 [Bacteroidales bacterium]|nr:hypothetical protein [Bacteroidales bacterium]
MKDIDQLIEQLHQAGRQRLESDSISTVGLSHSTERVSHPLLRYAAMVAAVIVAGVLLLPSRQEQKMPDVASADVPQPVRQQLKEARQAVNAPQSVAPHTEYAYSESSDGVRVYCEDNCNPDEVLGRMMQVIKTLE